MNYYSAIKRNKLLINMVIWMGFKSIMASQKRPISTIYIFSDSINRTLLL